jgi:hypothetical protein
MRPSQTERIRSSLEAGKHADGIALAEKILRHAEVIDGPNYATLGRTLNLVGALHAAQDRLGEAERMFERSLAFGTEGTWPDHPDVRRSPQ